MSDLRLADPTYPQRLAALQHEACLSNQQAVACLVMLWDAVELWDDLIDKDKNIDDQDIHRVFTSLMFWLPQNVFFDQNKHYLLPLIMTFINAWHDANELQKSSDMREKQDAWHLKQMGIELIGAFAFLIGGFDHMRNVSIKARNVLRHEPFQEFVKEH